MSKNAMVRIKRGLSREQTNEESVARSLELNETKPVKKALFLTNPPQDQTTEVTFASRDITSLAA